MPLIKKIEIEMDGQRFEVSGEESEDHLREVARLVQSKIEGLRRANAQLSLHKAALLTAMDLASQQLKDRDEETGWKRRVAGKIQSWVASLEEGIQRQLQQMDPYQSA